MGGWRFGEVFGENAGSGGEFVEADGNGLAEIHGRLAGVGGDFDEMVAEGEVFAGEAVFFRAEDDGDPGVLFELLGEGGGELIEAKDRLFGFAVCERAGAKDERAVANGLRNCWDFDGVSEEIRSADGRAGFAPVGLVRRNDGEVREAEVGHGAGDCADVERIARGDEDDGDAVALVRGEQGMILEPGRESRR